MALQGRPELVDAAPSVATVSTIGGGQPSARSCAELDHRQQLGDRALRAWAVRHVDHEQVRHLQDAGLERLDGVAEARHRDHGDGVGDLHDVELALADPDRLQQHQVEAVGVQQPCHVPAWPRPGRPGCRARPCCG